ncbi:MAG: prepilin peptidase [Erysipelotrichia bacterium]|nr:prepilin peptidase [Erysipelotrichia bacterium]
MDFSPTHPQIIAAIVAMIAMYTDLKWGRIYNWLTFPAIFTGWALNIAIYGMPGLGYSVAATLLGIFIYIPFALFGLMGMGDVKLLGAIGALGGSYFVFSVFLYTSALGTLHAVLIQLLNYGKNAFSMLLTSFSTGIFLQKTIKKENETTAKEGKYRFLLGIDIFIATLIAIYHTFIITL